jgi:hypothetical protein
LSREERIKPGEKGLQMAADIFGLDYPQYDLPPVVHAGLLRETARLMRKHGFIDRRDLRLEDFIDNSLVQEAMERTGLGKVSSRL